MSPNLGYSTPHQVLGGNLGDYLERVTQEIAPGSLRRPLGPVGRSPVATAAKGAAVAPEPTSFRWTQEIPFDTMEAFTFNLALANTAYRIDRPLRIGRRAVLVVNTHPAAAVFVASSEGVVGNGGIFVAPGGGAVSLPISDKVPVWAFSTVATTIVSIAQFA